MSQQTLAGVPAKTPAAMPQPFLTGPCTERPFEGHGACPKCSGPLTIRYGPFGKRGERFAQLGCKACDARVRFVPWPDPKSHTLQHLRGSDVCKCGAVMLWGVSEKGVRKPLQPIPVQGMDAQGRVTWVRESHFAYCPHADEFRKR